MKNKLYIAIIISSITGCATTSSLNPMPEKTYNATAALTAGITYCFEKEHISPQFYADTKNAISYSLNTWSWDRNKLSSMADAVYTELTNSDGEGDVEGCRFMEAKAYELISDTKQHRADLNQQRADQRQNQTDLNDTLREINRNKPIYCNTIGTMTLCN